MGMQDPPGPRAGRLSGFLQCPTQGQSSSLPLAPQVSREATRLSMRRSQTLWPCFQLHCMLDIFQVGLPTCLYHLQLARAFREMGPQCCRNSQRGDPDPAHVPDPAPASLRPS